MSEDEICVELRDNFHIVKARSIGLERKDDNRFCGSRDKIEDLRDELVEATRNIFYDPNAEVRRDIKEIENELED